MIFFEQSSAPHLELEVCHKCARPAARSGLVIKGCKMLRLPLSRIASRPVWACLQSVLPMQRSWQQRLIVCTSKTPLGASGYDRGMHSTLFNSGSSLWSKLLFVFVNVTNIILCRPFICRKWIVFSGPKDDTGTIDVLNRGACASWQPPGQSRRKEDAQVNRFYIQYFFLTCVVFTAASVC